MSTIGSDEVAHVAGLARLALSDDETTAMTRDLEKILGHVRSLEALDTEGVPPTAGFELATPLRADEPAAPFDPELARWLRHPGTNWSTICTFCERAGIIVCRRKSVRRIGNGFETG